jgi:hypothetical protein
MVEQGVFLSPGDCSGMPDHFRIGFGSQVDGIEAALALIPASFDPDAWRR